MLKTLDILIGSVTVILIFSMAVTVITQAITAILNRKGKHLKEGIASLLLQLGIADSNAATTIADKVLTHPMISVDGRPGSVIHRDELTRLLLDFAAGKGAAGLETSAKSALETLLKDGGIPNPAEGLKNIHDMALQLEAADPGLANYMRDGLAVLHGVPSEFVSRLHSWFDQSIDRVSERFTQYTHAVVVGVSLVVVLLVQLNIIDVVNRLSIDDELRASLVRTASTIPAPAKLPDSRVTVNQDMPTATQSSPVSAGSPDGGGDSARPKPPVPATAGQGSTSNSGDGTSRSSGASTPPAGGVKDPLNMNSGSAQTPESGDKKKDSTEESADPEKLDFKPYYDLLSNAGLVTLPRSWSSYFKTFLHNLPGMIISVLLLSLGAPFWYKALAQLLQLRSAIAGKDDAQRQQRQGAPSTDGGGGVGGAVQNSTSTAVTSNLLKGESGNLAAVG